MIRIAKSLDGYLALTLTCLTVGGCCSTEKASKVVLVSVSPTKATSSEEKYTPETPTIHKAKKERLLWVSPPGSKLSQIIITIPGGSVPPFQRCVVSADKCRISCNPDGVCASGRIHDSWSPPPKGDSYYYAYDVAFMEGPIIDPGFIIKP